MEYLKSVIVKVQSIYIPVSAGIKCIPGGVRIIFRKEIGCAKRRQEIALAIVLWQIQKHLKYIKGKRVA